VHGPQDVPAAARKIESDAELAKDPPTPEQMNFLLNLQAAMYSHQCNMFQGGCYRGAVEYPLNRIR